MNMPVDNAGTVHFTTTLFALVREALSIKMGTPEMMDAKDNELRETIKMLWPVQAKQCLDLLIPPNSEYAYTKLTVGKIYVALLIYENWQLNKGNKAKQNSQKPIFETCLTQMLGHDPFLNTSHRPSLKNTESDQESKHDLSLIYNLNNYLINDQQNKYRYQKSMESKSIQDLELKENKHYDQYHQKDSKTSIKKFDRQNSIQLDDSNSLCEDANSYSTDNTRATPYQYSDASTIRPNTANQIKYDKSKLVFYSHPPETDSSDVGTNYDRLTPVHNQKRILDHRNPYYSNRTNRYQYDSMSGTPLNFADAVSTLMAQANLMAKRNRIEKMWRCSAKDIDRNIIINHRFSPNPRSHYVNAVYQSKPRPNVHVYRHSSPNSNFHRNINSNRISPNLKSHILEPPNITYTNLDDLTFESESTTYYDEEPNLINPNPDICLPSRLTNPNQPMNKHFDIPTNSDCYLNMSGKRKQPMIVHENIHRVQSANNLTEKSSQNKHHHRHDMAHPISHDNVQFPPHQFLTVTYTLGQSNLQSTPVQTPKRTSSLVFYSKPPPQMD